MEGQTEISAETKLSDAQFTDTAIGLTEVQVNERIADGRVNGDTGSTTKTEKQIILENVFTFFNIVNFILAGLLIIVGSFKNMTFLLVVLSNTVIGSFQEIRSKRTIDKLSLISSPKVEVIRDAIQKTIQVSEIVMDDLLILGAGNQICADSVVLDGEIEVNESLITGESDPIIKKKGDSLLSGSFVVSGTAKAQVIHVGAENYASKIAGDAKYVKKPNSEIMNTLNKIVKTISFSLVPVGVALFVKQFVILNDSFRNSIVSMVAALIGMIPEGLVLLTSVVFAVSVVRLSKHNTLVQELYCIETLARVDVLCLDKTGTITEGTMQVDEFVPFEGHTQDEMESALKALINSLNDSNPTFNALLDKLGKGNSDWVSKNTVPFSSARKWSGCCFETHGTFLMGAGEFIFGEKFAEIKPLVESYSADGHRVLILAHSDNDMVDKEVPAGINAVGLVLISDKIRAEAPSTLRYFADQGVDLKVISGDNAVTVSNIARKAGLDNADEYVDASTLKTDEDIEKAILKYSVFGRVTPDQKLKFVKALKKNGHTVAMTGDGVNDVLALKEADCSVAMASGSDAARTVSNLVLLDSNFASMPKVVQEGRRSINNLQRSAALFISKTIFSVLLAVLFIFANATYPFQPIQLSLISVLTIGIPSFILALEPNKDRVKGKFIINVLNKCIPTAIPMFLNIAVLICFESSFGLSSAQISTIAVITTFFTGCIMLVRVSIPFNLMRGSLFTALVIAFILAYIFLSGLFSLVTFDLVMITVLIPMLLFTIFCSMVVTHLMENVLTLGGKND